MEKPELLSPAGNFECLKMAVMAGATAVYFAAKNFNARAKADNFDEDLAKAVSYAHMFGVKVYLTLNTLLEQSEVDSLCDLVLNAMRAGVDAFIVQDFGVVGILKNCFPNAVIHASTQMGINNYQGAIKAEQMGISRVVLSRETSLNDIKLIRKNTNLEIEYFIQGALCVCFSGNCYMSSCLFNKSGNKGECLQPCRLPYKAVLKGKTLAKGYLLSAKDINMSNRLKDLISAGVSSFKIEGRLRRPSYVYHTTKVYSDIINRDFQVSYNDQQILKKSFNRGDYCEGYFNGNANIIDKEIQGHKGIKIGKVVKINNGKKFNIITINSNNINKGDVLKIINSDSQTVMTAKDIVKESNSCNITTKNIVKVGSDVYLISDVKLEDLSQIDKKLPISVKLFAYFNQPLKLKYELKYGNNQTLLGEIMGDVCQPAKTQPLCEEFAKESFEKLKETEYVLSDFSLNTQNAFVTKRQLNELRHAMLKKIDEALMQNQNVKYNYDYLKETERTYINSKACSHNDISIEINDKYNSNADYYVIKPNDYLKFNYDKIEHKNAYLYIPSYLPNEDYIIVEQILQKHENLGAYVQNIGALDISSKIILGAKLNLKNSLAIKQVLSKSVTLIEASPELSAEQYNILKQKFDVPFTHAIFDNFELMTLAHCPIKMLFNNTCANCKYCDQIEYIMQDGSVFELKRTKIANCIFNLVKK